MLPKTSLLGDADMASRADGDVAPLFVRASSSRPAGEKPTADTMLNAFDFEAVARETLSAEAWGYYSSGADDEITLRENHAAFHRVWLRPRVLIDVAKVDTSTVMAGTKVALPVYLTATAMGKLAHPDGEQAIVRAAAKRDVVYMLPTLSSCTLEEMLDARADGQVLWSQLYVNSDRQRTKAYVEELHQRGVKALFVTVDAPQLGRREKDMRNKFKVGKAAEQSESEAAADRDRGVARAISTFIDPSLSWKDLAWLQALSPMPVYLKGVQCAEDAVLALRAKCAGVVLSNHGGRQLDASRSALEVLDEVMPALRAEPGYSRAAFEVFIDGGVRRGADVFKALAMGAAGVGVGRPVLYSLAAFGQPGVERMLHVLKEELEMVMQLMGTRSVADIGSRHVITKDLASHMSATPRDFLSERTYERLQTQAERAGFAKPRL